MIKMHCIMLRHFRRFICLILTLFLFVVVQSCVVATKKTVITPTITTLFKGTYKVDPYLEKHKPRTVAVLPFIDQSRSKKGFETVRKHFYNHFSSIPYKDMELYRIDRLLRKAGLTDPEVINKTSPQGLGKILGVDAVVFGETSNFDKIFAMVYSQVSVGAEIKMYDTKTGHFLWSGQHVARIHEGGISTTPVGIVATIIASAINMRDVQLLRACDDLFRDMVKTIPAPTIAEALRPPDITLLTQDTKGLPKKAGDEIRVVIKGTPRMQASFDIGEYKKSIDMVEVEPGGYLGTYKVVPGDNVANAIITGYLTDDSGNIAHWIDAIGSVTLDTTSPAKPQNLTGVGRDGFVLLKWDKNAESDLTGYLMYRSDTPLSGFKKVVGTEFNYQQDSELINFQRYFYKVSAVDRAGNESEKTGTIVGMPVPPGPTPVSGSIEVDTIWHAGASPYVIEDTVLVKDKTLLTIEPGTEIQSKGGGLVIEGCLVARGDDERVISFDAIKGGLWDGITFNNVKGKENLMQFCRVKNAKAGITCTSSSPCIEACELTANMVGIKVLGAFSRPDIGTNMIHKNSKIGIFVASGAQPTIVQNKIRSNAEGGIVVKDASPTVQHNWIIQNHSSGITVQNSQMSVVENNIYDNKPFDMVGTMSGEAVNACDNWWGGSDCLDILAGIKGKINIGSVLNGAWPDGKSIKLPILAPVLSGLIKSDAFFILSNGPYRVVKDVIVDQGAVLYIEPGVKVDFDQNTSIIVRDGGVVARGTLEHPIMFTSSGVSPSAGDYLNAIRFERKTNVNSLFEYCIVKYATTAFDVYYGTPEISYCYIANNAQCGVYCRNDAAPKIFYNTITNNLGEGGIKCVGMSRPRINYNNFIDNAVAIQAFSSIQIDARNNWWGKSTPDKNVIWGDNINIEPWLKAPRKGRLLVGKK